MDTLFIDLLELFVFLGIYLITVNSYRGDIKKLQVYKKLCETEVSVCELTIKSLKEHLYLEKESVKELKLNEKKILERLKLLSDLNKNNEELLEKWMTPRDKKTGKFINKS